VVIRAAVVVVGLATAFIPRLGHSTEQPPVQSIQLASTTSVDNSGLLGHILPLFTNETGIAVRVLAQGTG
jgi:tungstate transport system substrate-binding protein